VSCWNLCSFEFSSTMAPTTPRRTNSRSRRRELLRPHPTPRHPSRSSLSSARSREWCAPRPRSLFPICISSDPEFFINAPPNRLAMTRRSTTAQQQLLTSIVRAGLHVHGFCTSIRFRSYVEATGLRHVPDALEHSN
jgi:hypothetical protein